MDQRALTQSGEIVIVEEAPVASPFLRWFVMGALATLPIHALIFALYWSFFA